MAYQFKGLQTIVYKLETDQQAEQMLTTWRSKQDANALIDEHHPTLAKGLQQFEKLVVALSG